MTEGGWFSDLSKFVKEKNIEYILTDNTHQYNGDETGFQLDPQAGRVSAPKGETVYTEAVKPEVLERADYTHGKDQAPACLNTTGIVCIKYIREVNSNSVVIP